MPKRKKILSIPPEVKLWLDTHLVENNFSGYEAITAYIKSEYGLTLSRATIQRYGKDFQDRLEAVKLASEQAKAVVNAAPDDEGAVNEALMRLVQEHLFKLLMSTEKGGMDLPKVARAVAELGRATVTQKRWQTEVRGKAKAAADAVEKVAKKGGLTPEAVDTIRREILGIAA